MEKAIESYWKENENLFLFEYHATPKFETEIIGAFINCWVIEKDFNTAKYKSQSLIEKENWEINSLEDISEIKRGGIAKSEDNFKYYEQVIIDKEVLVFYTYDSSH